MAITWQTTAPTVVSWGTELITDEYEAHQADTYRWYMRIKYSVGRIPGTKSLAVRAIIQGHKAKGWVAQECTGRPRVRLAGSETWTNGSSMTKTIDSTSWTNIGTQYAIITGLTATTNIYAGYTQGSATTTVYVTLTYPISSVLTITLNPEGGTVSPATTYSKTGDPYWPLPTPTKTVSERDIPFLGWFTQEKGGSKVTSSTVVSKSSNHTLYAHWDATALLRVVENGVVKETSAIKVVSNGIVKDVIGVYYVKDGIVKQGV